MAASRAGVNFLGALTLMVLSSLAIVVAYDRLTDPGDPLRPRTLFAASEISAGEVRTFVLSTRNTAELTAGSVEGAGVVVHVVRLDDGELRAFDARSTHPHRRCTTAWREVAGAQFGRELYFSDPCSGSVFTLDGTRIFGPAPRGLDRVQLAVRDGLVVVDPSPIGPAATTSD
jgi:hypothetical protein